MASFSTNYSAALGNILSQVNDAFSGKSSGIDVSSVVDSMMQVEDQPETQMKDEQSSLDAQISALTTIGSELSTLSNSVNSLGDFDGALNQFTTGSSDAAVVSAAASDTATAGTHTVTVTSLATTSSSYSGYISPGVAGGHGNHVKYGNPSNPTSTDTIDIPSTDTTLARGGQLHQFRKLWGDRQRGNGRRGIAAGADQQDLGSCRQSDGEQFGHQLHQHGRSGCATDRGRGAGGQRQQHRNGSDSRGHAQPGRGRSQQPDTDYRGARYHPGSRRHRELRRLLQRRRGLHQQPVHRRTPVAAKVFWRATACCKACKAACWIWFPPPSATTGNIRTLSRWASRCRTTARCRSIAPP